MSKSVADPSPVADGSPPWRLARLGRFVPAGVVVLGAEARITSIASASRELWAFFGGDLWLPVVGLANVEWTIAHSGGDPARGTTIEPLIVVEREVRFAADFDGFLRLNVPNTRYSEGATAERLKRA